MLHCYKNTTLHNHLTAYICDKATKERKAFKYRLMTDAEIDETQFMRGLDSSTTKMDIATNNSINVNTKSQLIIDGYYWAIETIKEKITKSNSGMFRKADEKIIYMALSSGGTIK